MLTALKYSYRENNHCDGDKNNGHYFHINLKVNHKVQNIFLDTIITVK